MKILIADDEIYIRRIISKSASKWGYEIVEASNGNEALDILNTDDHPRIAIIDWMMPGINGIELCKIMSQKENKKFIYMIMLTARTKDEDLIKALDNGAHDFQRKPLSLPELKSRLTVGTRLVCANDKLLHYADSMEILAKEKALQLVEMEKRANKDILTDVYSRLYLIECGTMEVDRCIDQNLPLSVILIDVDNFKHINDNFGHGIGDDALITISKICKRQLRNCDIFGRMGGDEFVAIIPEINIDMALNIASRMRLAIINQTDIDMRLDISYGVSDLQDSDTIESIIDRADKSMYDHKHRKKMEI